VPCGVLPFIIGPPSPIAECHGRHSATNILIHSIFSNDIFQLIIIYKTLVIFFLRFIIKSFNASGYSAGGLPVTDQKQSNLYSYDNIILLFFSYNHMKM
jgi:hypothetical protein